MASPCLSAERIAELVEGRLVGDALAEASRHLAGCAECRELVTSAAAVLDDAPDPPPPSSRSRAEPSVLERNERVGRYVIDRLIGAGGMGRVYAAHDPALERVVALKLLRPDVVVPDMETRLLREAKAMARISHPHVIAVYDAGRHGDAVYLAMEFIAGGTLREWQRETGRTWREILDVYLKAGRGLAEAHAAGIIHRDFKPDNVLVSEDGKALRVTDFGLARAAPTGDDVVSAEADTQLAPVDPGSLDSALTRTGAVLGTPVYMAPEQHSAKPVDARSDVYSFSVALYEALYGERPFAGTTFAALLAAKLANQVRGAPAGRNVPPRLRRAVLAGLRAEPGERPQSMDAMLDSLVSATRTSRSPRALAASALVVAAASVVYVAGTRRAHPVPSAGAAPTAALTALPSCSNRACSGSHGGGAWVCRPGDHACVAVDSDECRAYFEPGDLAAEDTVWLGALFPTTGPLENVGTSNVHALELARREFAHATRALTGPSASMPVRRVALAVCDDETVEGATRAAEHLVKDVGVPAIAGFRSGQEVMDLTGTLLIQNHVLALATLTPSPLITKIPQPGDLPRMVWRTGSGFDDVARATAAFIHQYFEPRLTPRGATMSVGLLRGEAPGHVAFGEALLRDLFFNGKTGVANGDRYQAIPVPTGVELAADRARIERVTERAVRFAPSVIVMLGETSAQPPLVRAIEARWPGGAPRPTYLIAADTLDHLAEVMGASAELRHRMFGVISSVTSNANAQFVSRYNDAFEPPVSRSWNPGTSYDAFYLFAYGANALGGEGVSGPAVARAFGRLTGSGRPIEVGPSQAFEALSELWGGRTIDLDGAGSSMDFDLATGEVSFDYALVCARAGRTGAAIAQSDESGLTYRTKRRSVEGRVVCP